METAMRLAHVLAMFSALVLLTVSVVPARAHAGTATPVAAAAPVAFVWQTGGSPQLDFDDPFQFAIDPQGNLWVADGQHSRFQIFASDGTFREIWGTPGNDEGEFDFTFSDYDPTGAAAFDASGALYVADPGNLRVQKFDAERHFVAAWGSLGAGDGEFLHPYDIAVDAAGHVYVIDDVRDDVQVFTGDGHFLRTIARHGNGEGALNDTGGLAVARDGTVWVADFGNNRIQAFAPDGAFLRIIGSPGAGEGEFITPVDVAVDAQGQIYVVDTGNYRVQVFAADGRYLAQFGGYGTEENEFALPAGIALDGAGHAYVSDPGLDRVKAFRLLALSNPATPVA
jgi:DNA-binding beta-propeller fold protein YncE